MSEAAQTVDATKVKMGRDEALRLARAAQTVVAGRGKKVVTLEVANASDDELLAVLLGPTGNLKAPTLRIGTTLLVGFAEPAYAAVFQQGKAAS